MERRVCRIASLAVVARFHEMLPRRIGDTRIAMLPISLAATLVEVATFGEDLTPTRQRLDF